MITYADYYMGRDIRYPNDLLGPIKGNVIRTVDITNRLLVLLKVSTVPLEINPRTGSVVASGWRPPALNAATPGASRTSLHMSGEAIDLYDPSGEIDKWLSHNIKALVDLGLWLEHPDATPGWSHVQVRPPKSGNRIFRP
jgi:hypothetical protein